MTVNKWGMAAILLAAGLTASTGARAQDEEEKGWSGVGEFGYVSTTGNTETETLNLGLEFKYKGEVWEHRISASALTASKDNVDDAERYVLELQSDRFLTERSYLWGAFRYDADKFGTYDPQMTLAAGYGYYFIKREGHEFKGEVGVGYRDYEETNTGITGDDTIFRGLLEDQWQITDTTSWNNRLLVESGADNTFTQFNTALSVAINAKFAVKVGYEWRNNSDVPVGDDKTDTTTTVNLVYNF